MPEQDHQEDGWTRREFLKKAGLGAVSLGAFSLMPSASAINIRDSDGMQVFADGTKHFDVQNGGPVAVNQTDLKVDPGDINVPQGEVLGKKITGEDMVAKGRTLETGESLTIPSNQGATVEEEYTAKGSLTVNGDMQITKPTSEINHSALQGSHPKSHLSLLAETEITAVGGSTPAFDGTIPNVSRDQTQPIDVTVTPKNAEAFTYAYNTSVSKIWNGGAWDIEVTVNWDKDPGSGNNVKMKIQIQER